MTSKCWFVLKQKHYPPPTIPKSGTGKVSGSGPICLGHMVPDLAHLDNVINRHGPFDIPLDMPIHTSKQWDLTYTVNETRGIGFSGNAGVPIAAAAGLTIEVDAGVAFTRTITNYWEFNSLVTSIIQPTMEYIEDSIEADEVMAYLERRGTLKSSTLFMITGIIVARGAKSNLSEVSKRELHGGQFPAMAKAGIAVGVSKDHEFSSTANKSSDFVWAVRLAKISKGLIDRKWSQETFSKGATFDLTHETDKKRAMVDALRSEGLEISDTNCLDMKFQNHVFIIGADDEIKNF